MPDHKPSKALEFQSDEMEVELIGREDSTIGSDFKYQRVGEQVAQMILLGKKRGRPTTEEKAYEEAA